MAKLFFQDTVAFLTDPSIIGTVELTSTKIDESSFSRYNKCYFHKNLPTTVQDSWIGRRELNRGHVIVSFSQEYEGYCLVSETSLRLIDRALTTSDAVKRSPSDAQSGVVISTSLACELRPLCSTKGYNAQYYDVNRGLFPSGEDVVQIPGIQVPYGFPPSVEGGELNRFGRHVHSSPLKISAQELIHWNNYREQDFVLYRNWVGKIINIEDEVAVRLTNGSVVIVEDPEQLEEPYWLPGSPSYELAKRLHHADYHRYDSRSRTTPQSTNAKPCYPGQHVQTNLTNLQRGRWLFGAYDPAVTPRGIVAEVRRIQLGVRWLYPDMSLSLRDQANPPSASLTINELKSGKVLAYNRGRSPKHSAKPQLPDAVYSPYVRFGYLVRLKDPQGAATKYGTGKIASADLSSSNSTSHPTFDWIPRLATQGFDMNVLQVTSTFTKALVQWQDGSLSEDNAVDLYPHKYPDEHDVWPGDKVSLRSEKEDLGSNSADPVLGRKIGVVQRVDASRRMCHVRWSLNVINRSWKARDFHLGPLSDRIEELPLYDIAIHRALLTERGYLAVLLPELAPTMYSAGSAIPQTLPLPTSTNAKLDSSDDAAHTIAPSSSEYTSGSGQILNVEWFGEVIEACLDGDVVIRLGAAQEARDIKVSANRVLVVVSGGLGSNSDESFESINDSDASEDTSSDSSTGGVQLIASDDTNDEGVRRTIRDDQGPIAPVTVSQASRSRTETDIQESTSVETSPPSITNAVISYSSFPSMISQFSILEQSPPMDHQFVNGETTLTAALMRRILKENAIMQISLPDGIFVRTWDSRIDLLGALIIGPHETPYEFAPFVFDLHFGASFPTSPPSVFFHSWTENVGRINPNLYEDGTVCLSLLGTWTGQNRDQEWQPKQSTTLQLPTSIMGLILVKEPYYNEPGFEVLDGSGESRPQATQYKEKAYVMSKAFVKKAVSDPPQGLGDLIDWLYLSPQGPGLLRRVVYDRKPFLPEHAAMEEIDKSRHISIDSRDEVPAPPTTLSAGAQVLLRRNFTWLNDHFRRNEEKTASTSQGSA